jgi:hypothetical protein
MPLHRPHRLAPALICALALAACAGGPRSAVQSLPPGSDARTQTLAEVKDALDGAGASAARIVIDTPAPMITGLGLAQIAGQPGKTANEKRLMAIRAARMDALRDLTEQVHGIRLSAQTSVHDMVVQDDSLRAMVEGTIRGARTLRITPRDPDAYEVQMALDRDTVGYILRATRGAF